MPYTLPPLPYDYNALEPFAGDHEEPWCYAAIGHTQTEIAIGVRQGLLFARSLAVGGKIFSDAVAQATGLPPAQAEVRKHVDCGLRETDACCETLRAAGIIPIGDYRYHVQLPQSPQESLTGVYRA